MQNTDKNTYMELKNYIANLNNSFRLCKVHLS